MNFLRGKKKWSIIFGAKNKHVFGEMGGSKSTDSRWFITNAHK